nr:DUF3048 domain-containing protein [Thalassobacillus pellis]
MLSLIALAACSEEGASPKNTEKEKSGEVEEKEKEPAETAEKKQVYPLTGKVTDKSIDHRALAVMVNNHTKARPQTGLSDADIVYEVLAEGMITRFLAVFHSEIPDTIGPVRSARPYYVELAKGFDAIYIYHGAAKFIDEQIQKDGIDFLNGAYYDNDGKLFERASFREAPHNSYLLTSGIKDALERKGYDMEKKMEPLPFSEKGNAADGGKLVSKLKIVYSNNPLETVSYSYNKKSEKYVRSSDGELSVEYGKEKALAVDNVFIVETKHRVVDSAGRRKVDLTSGGKGYLLQKGKLHEVTWKNEDGRIVPENMEFVPGQTWINIVPEDPGISRSVSFMEAE